MKNVFHCIFSFIFINSIEAFNNQNLILHRRSGDVQVIGKNAPLYSQKNVVNFTREKSVTRKISLPLPPFPNGDCGGKIVSISPDKFDKPDMTLLQPETIFLPPRPIEVWLPPTYLNNEKSQHPVLYVHDGQNAIEDSSSWTGSSWRLAGALTRLHERQLLRTPPITSENKHTICTDSLPILVLMPSSEGDFLPGMRRRHLEYADLSNPIASAHADFVAERLKPYIDSTFRTLSQKEHTYAMGTSLGGQASVNLLLSHGDLFNNAACLSPCFQPGTVGSVLSFVASNAVGNVLNPNSKEQSMALKGKRIYIDNGGDVDDIKVPLFDLMDHTSSQHWWNPGYWWLDTQLQPSIDMMKMALDALKERKIIDFEWHRYPGARHNERAWAWRIDKPMLFLFGHRDGQ